MEIRKTPTIKDYFAGAVLANSIAWLTLCVTAFFEIDPSTFVQLLSFAYMFGTIIAGYLIARKAFQNHLKVGLKTGLGSFVFHVYVFMGVIELLTGRRLMSLVEHLLISAIFVSGGFIGAFLWKQFSSRKRSTS